MTPRRTIDDPQRSELGGEAAPGAGADAPSAPLSVTIRVRTAGLVLACIGVALVIAHLAVNVLAEVGVVSYTGRLVRVFDLNTEGSVPTYVSLMLLAAVALGAAAVAAASESRAARWSWGVLSAVFAWLSLDEGASLHESVVPFLRGALGIEGGFLWYAWVIPAGILLLVAAPFAIRFLVSLPPTTRKMLIAAGALYLSGAIGVEILSATAGAEIEADLRSAHDPAVWLLVALEEGLEIAGIVVMNVAVLRHLRDEALRGRGILARLT